MKRPLAYVGFSMAETLLLLNIISFKYSKAAAVTAAILFAVSLIIRKTRRAKVLPAVFGAALFSCLVFMFVYSNTVAPQLALDGQTAYARFKITAVSETSGIKNVYIAKTEAVGDSSAPQNIKIKLYSDSAINADYYDVVTAKITFSSLADNAMSSYGNYGDGIFLNGTVEEIISVKDAKKPVSYYLIELRQAIKNIVTDKLGGDTGALALALLVGNTSEISDEIYENFTSCGVTHIMSVSGLHTSVICLGFYYLLRKLNVNIKVRVILSLVLLTFYTAVSGFSKSVIRSAVMTAVLLISQAINKKADSLNSLGISVIILCLNPFAVSDAGAVLTVTSVTGMLCIKPIFDKYFRHKAKFKAALYLYEGFAVTMSVIISTFPFMWIYFGNISLTSFIANYLFIPLSEWAMVSALIMILLSFSSVLCIPFVGLTYSCAKLMILLAEFFADNFSFFNVDIRSLYMIAAYSVIVAFIGIYIAVFKNANVKICSCFALAVLTFCSAMSIYENKNTAYLYIYTSDCVVFRCAGASVVIGADSRYDYYSVKETVGNAESSNIYYINCGYNKEKLERLSKNNCEFLSNIEFNADLSNALSVKCNDGIISFDCFENYVKITDDYVYVNGTPNRRSARYTDENAQDTVYIFKEGSCYIWQN